MLTAVLLRETQTSKDVGVYIGVKTDTITYLF